MPKSSAVLLLDLLDGRAAAGGSAARRVEAGEDLLRELGGDGAAGEGAERDDADQRALERADVVGDAVGDDLEGAVGGRGDLVLLRALAQDREAGGGVGGADVGDEAGLEALAQAGLHVAEVAREAVGGEDDLGAGLVQRVEGVEELLLRADLGLEELDVVDEQDVDAAVGGLEGVGVAAVDGADEVVGEGLGGGVADGRAAAVGRDVVARSSGAGASCRGRAGRR